MVGLDNKKTTGFSGDSSVKYSNLFREKETFTMFDLLSGNSNDSIEERFMIFKDKNNSYSILGVPDDMRMVT